MATNFIIRYYLSADQIFQSANDYLLSDVTVNSLTAGDSTTKNPTFTILTTVQAGDYYILDYVDRLTHVAELNESNNVLASSENNSKLSNSFFYFWVILMC